MTIAPTWPLSTVPRSADAVRAASYPDFVAMTNQTNVMPGAHATLNTWALHSRLGTQHHLLDAACTTGFTSRELARLTGCTATGFDLSHDSVALARYNHRLLDPTLRLTYHQADGTTYRPEHTFSHIAVGAALGFFPDPPAMATRLLGFLDDGGYVLAAPFWAPEPLPDHAAAVRRQVFGITSPMETRDQALALFAGLDVLHQADHPLTAEPAAAIEHYCRSTVDRACEQSGNTDPAVRTAMTERLREIKHATNTLRAHQRYTVLVLRYDARAYPNRYVELF
ncbi:class I SAM-dependent methyltransferase [Kitasatospora sp. A2-31]|uniref:class I SAM-dependent methyltransferase n=1 Tax=Kitasatospora sp. A2-31 TaxID=2916414 RepID=UPI001EEB716C|nr:class I SAM-dependent methyltransferase [Kitasatospora sp. A2-31]MCG6496920.1 class I SAM-dependent methyltransferase [Kitasatospora sp. A2-31]